MFKYFFISGLLGFFSIEVLCTIEKTRPNREELLKQMNIYEEEIAKHDEELKILDEEISRLPQDWEKQKKELEKLEALVMDLESDNYDLKRDIKMRQEEVDKLKEQLEEKEIQCFLVEQSQNQKNISQEKILSQLKNIDSDIKQKDDELKNIDFEINKLEVLGNKSQLLSLWEIERDSCYKIRDENQDCQVKLWNKELKEKDPNPAHILSTWHLEIKNLLSTISDKLESKNVTESDDRIIPSLELIKKELRQEEIIQRGSIFMRKVSRKITRYRQNITVFTQNINHKLVVNKIKKEFNTLATELETKGIQHSTRIPLLKWNVQRCNNSFNKEINDYKKGFGHDQLFPNSPNIPDCHKRAEVFFIGLENIHKMTSTGSYTLNINLTGRNGTKFASYNRFKIGGSDDRYQIISLGTYTGTAGNIMKNMKGKKFSTMFKATTNEELQCAQHFKFGWWYSPNCMKK